MSISQSSAQTIDLIRPLTGNCIRQVPNHHQTPSHQSFSAVCIRPWQGQSADTVKAIGKKTEPRARATDKNPIASSTTQVLCNAPAVSYMSLYQPTAH